MISFFFKFTFSFTISFLILAFPVRNKTLFSHIHFITEPLTAPLYDRAGEVLDRGIDEVAGFAKALFKKPLPRPKVEAMKQVASRARQTIRPQTHAPKEDLIDELTKLEKQFERNIQAKADPQPRPEKTSRISRLFKKIGNLGKEDKSGLENYSEQETKALKSLLKETNF